jgi:hypothetical protein
MIRRIASFMLVLFSFAVLAPRQLMASSPYPNSYAITHSYRFDRTVGANGTIYITATVTGAACLIGADLQVRMITVLATGEQASSRWHKP